MDGGGVLGCDNNCVTDVHKELEQEEGRVDECTVAGEDIDVDVDGVDECTVDGEDIDVDVDGVGECASTLSLLVLDFCLALVFPSFGGDLAIALLLDTICSLPYQTNYC